MGINKGECCTVLDNSKRVKWSVVSSGGQKGMVPGAIFAIPPPNQEATLPRSRSVNTSAVSPSGRRNKCACART